MSKRLGLNALVISPHSLSSPPPSVEENPKRHRVFARPLLRRLDVQPVFGEGPLQRVMRAQQFHARDLAQFQPARRRQRLEPCLARIPAHREGVEPVALGRETDVRAGEVDALVLVEVFGRAREAAAMSLKENLLPSFSLVEKSETVSTDANTGGDPMTSANMRNWMECVRSRKTPNAPIEAGYNHSIALCMNVAAIQTGQKVTFDDKTQQVMVGGKVFA